MGCFNLMEVITEGKPHGTNMVILVPRHYHGTLQVYNTIAVKILYIIYC